MNGRMTEREREKEGLFFFWFIPTHDHCSQGCTRAGHALLEPKHLGLLPLLCRCKSRELHWNSEDSKQYTEICDTVRMAF